MKWSMPLSTYSLFPFNSWVSVAAIADISYYLTSISWKGFEISNVTGTIVMMIATILAFVFAVKNRDWCYPLVFFWAFIGIGVRNSTLSTRQSPLYPTSWLF
ncbi:hypothetical protein [Peribacillus butanolivorans]|uniref:hypothetical protein n=1 Tax=Peribacillus butanolivorans TaxID=421767 RepID=UPI001596ECB6|nr:hypothetical protein [Peribacillus butanolivorans]